MLTAIIAIFVIGYIVIALEHTLHINKAATALFIGVLCWTLYALDFDRMLPVESVPEWFSNKLAAEHEHPEFPNREFLIDGQLAEFVFEIAQILFFLMGAMTIVELIDAHEGFSIITNLIKARKKVTLLWIVAWITFFLSSVLDNLTTTIVMISLLRKLVHDTQTRRFFAGIVIIAANAGGAWSVIGDVTTTMLWVKHKIGTVETATGLFLASVACLTVPVLLISRKMTGELEVASESELEEGIDKNIKQWHRTLFFVLGCGGLVSVPIFKALTHLPPFMGILMALAVLWFVSELVSHTMDEETRSSTGVLAALKRIDMSSILFFLGILLAVGSLAATGTLQALAGWLDKSIGNETIIAIVIGLVSAVVDNVPLVAAGIEMYTFPENHSFWLLLSFCAGTGGSCLIIGSAAGVAAMGLEKIDFVWYLKTIAPWAFLGYVSGILVYLAQYAVVSRLFT
jgi:Na+/H+ antiporter NhaD/arsenite permease-like protein